ncbi:TPA: hypothetical protein ACWW98_002246 [Klebsiella pneumoniae]|uniref:hypothetical protein n=1 Tax=Klebsiella pneumoniae TaxID=573 RepID=UPI00065A40FD|nr:hypothetical protein [Klebsiella pneumoniae]KMI20093.1 hypothetical protein SM86_02735 [Klebsiella pneumoniae]MCM5931078.1 hypothetical protein [Klebsiella pneumoniae]MDF1983024.1 hypothetical protein [Klebsiella pneumoniae]MDV5674292.1 hypothetical protein [Klebsiella pneumoniae]MDW1350875.1 hypothetical protein [Klebsiella pneumoniae]
MEISGLIYLMLSGILFLKNRMYIFFLFICSANFFASSFINFSGKGIPLYIIGEIFLILVLLSKWKGNFSLISTAEVYFLFFIIWSTMVLVVSPGLFPNLQVSIDPDDLVMNGGRPNPSIFNFAQVVYLLIHYICFSLIIRCKKNNYGVRYELSFEKIIILLSWITCSFGFISYASRVFGVSDVLIPLFYNNPGYAQLIDAALRFQAGFPEASFCGAFLGAAFWVAFFHKRILLACVIVIAMLLSVSGSALISFFTGFCLYTFYYGRKKLIITLIVIVFLYIFLDLLGVLDYALAFIQDKGNSHSGDVRYSQAILALNIVKETYGLGIGMGITRGGGGLLNLMATTGIIGSLIFICFLVATLKKQRFDKVLYILSLLAAMVFTIPDISYPVLWAGIFLVAATSGKK